MITYETIRSVHRAERENHDLQELPEDFFSQAAEWAERRKRENDPLSAVESENARKLLDEIVMLRAGKTVRAAVFSLKGVPPPRYMTEKEAELYDAVVSLLKEHLSSSVPKAPGEKNINENVVKLRVKKDVPRIVDSSMKSYGPFKPGDEIEVPGDVANMLVTRGFAERV